jgi:hypothetical protein
MVPDDQTPFLPIIQEGEQPFAMMVDLQRKYTLHGHKLRLFALWEAQFVTVGII